MRHTEDLVEHVTEEHVMAIPDEIRDLPPEQLEIVMVALHEDIHEAEPEHERLGGVG